MRLEFGVSGKELPRFARVESYLSDTLRRYPVQSGQILIGVLPNPAENAESPVPLDRCSFGHIAP